MWIRRERLRRLCLLLGSGLLAARVEAAELTGFVSGAKPGEVWGTGLGGAIAIVAFNLVGLELEGAWQRGEAGTEAQALTGTGKAYLQVSIGRLVPYAGLSAGIYRQTLESRGGLVGLDDTGSFGGALVGVKLKLPAGIVLRGEYHWLGVPDDALLPMDGRFFAGLGLTF